MPRPRNDVVHIHVTLPRALGERLLDYLHSDLEGKVPYGAVQSFFTARTSEFFGFRSLDLAQWLNGMPMQNVVQGSPETLSHLITHLNKGATPYVQHRTR